MSPIRGARLIGFNRILNIRCRIARSMPYNPSDTLVMSIEYCSADLYNGRPLARLKRYNVIILSTYLSCIWTEWCGTLHHCKVPLWASSCHVYNKLGLVHADLCGP